jgi:hypothetical protein
MDWTALWHDSVWSKVIATAIGGAAGWIWRKRLTRVWSKVWPSPRLTVTHTTPSFDTRSGIWHPLKYYVEMRNDSSKCAEVALVRFDGLKVSVRSFPIEALQIRFHTNWYPEQSVDRIAVLPGQLCRVWIAVDHSKFDEKQLKAFEGQIGTLVIAANRKQISIKL